MRCALSAGAYDPRRCEGLAAVNTELVILRLLHIVPAAIWVGGAFVMAVFIEPATRALGPQVQGPLMRRLAPTLVPTLSAAAGTTVLFGLALVARTPGRGFDALFTSAWGWAIGLGMLAALVAFVAGIGTGMTVRRMSAAAPQPGTPPTPEQQQTLAGIQAQLRLYGRVNAGFALIAVACMAMARYV